MAQVYQSKTSGEFGLQGDDGRFSWISRDEARECLAASEPVYCEDGESMADDDPLWDDLRQVESIEE